MCEAARLEGFIIGNAAREADAAVWHYPLLPINAHRTGDRPKNRRSSRDADLSVLIRRRSRFAHDPALTFHQDRQVSKAFGVSEPSRPPGRDVADRGRS